MASNQNLNVSESMVHIYVQDAPGKEVTFAGVILDYDVRSVYVIADARVFQNDCKVPKVRIVTTLSRVELDLDKCHIENGLAGLMCRFKNGEKRMNTIKKMKICVRPLKMSEAVYVYEGIYKRLTSGNITRLTGPRFSHDCSVSIFAEFGSPVINKAGEMVGINHSIQCHLSGITISALLGPIKNIWRVVNS